MITPEEMKKWQDATGNHYPTKDMKEFKCTWDIGAVQQEYTGPKYLPEKTIRAINKAHALYYYELWLQENGHLPPDGLPPLEEYIKKEFASGGWGLSAEEV